MDRLGETSWRIDFTEVFNYGVLCHALATADNLGLFDKMSDKGVLSEDDLGEGLFVKEIASLLLAAAIFKMGIDNASYVAGPAFGEAMSLKGFFTWLFLGSGHVLVEATTGLDEASPRMGDVIGKATADFGRNFIDELLLEVVRQRSATKLLDIGCGDGSRLVKFATELGVSAVGVDLSPKAIDVALAREVRTSDSSEFTWICSDVLSLKSRDPRLEGVDVALMSLMAHDLWPESNFHSFLDKLPHIAPSIRTLIITETVRSTADPAAFLKEGIPTVGYEYLHSAMDQYIPTELQWLSTIDSAPGWVLAEAKRIEIPSNTVVMVLERT